MHVVCVITGRLATAHLHVCTLRLLPVSPYLMCFFRACYVSVFYLLCVCSLCITADALLYEEAIFLDGLLSEHDNDLMYV